MPIEKVHTTHKPLASGKTRIYYYTRRGGDLFWKHDGKPLQPPFPAEFVKAYNDAIGAEEPDPHTGDMDRLITAYLESADFAEKAERTKEGYRRYLEGEDNPLNARKQFGTASIKVVEDRRFRAQVLQWKRKIAKTSARDADLHGVALSQVLDYAYDNAEVVVNHARGLKAMYQKSTDHERLRPWTVNEIELFLQGNAHLPAERRHGGIGHNQPPAEPVGPADRLLSDVFQLAMFLALRLSDVATVKWSADKGSHFTFTTHKGKNKGRVATVPIIDEARVFLDRLKARRLKALRAEYEGTNVEVTADMLANETIILGDRGRKMLPGSIGSKLTERYKALDLKPTLHRLRNNFATMLVRADFKDPEIAEIMGWTEEDVATMKRVYVDREEIVAAQIERLTRARGE